MVAAGARSRSAVREIDIQQWIHERYGFAPHPYWIVDCTERCLDAAAGVHTEWKREHQCPADREPMVREALVHFGLMPRDPVSR